MGKDHPNTSFLNTFQPQATKQDPVRTTSVEGSNSEGLCQDAQNMSQAKAREW